MLQLAHKCLVDAPPNCYYWHLLLRLLAPSSLLRLLLSSLLLRLLAILLQLLLLLSRRSPPNLLPRLIPKTWAVSDSVASGAWAQSS